MPRYSTAAEKERKGDANFVKGGRAARDAIRKRHIEDVLQQLDKTALICARSAARKRELHRGITDPALRRKERCARARDLLAEYQVVVAPLLAWFAEVEADPQMRSPLLALLEKAEAEGRG